MVENSGWHFMGGEGSSLPERGVEVIVFDGDVYAIAKQVNHHWVSWNEKVDTTKVLKWKYFGRV